jgi:hypothetical protein
MNRAWVADLVLAALVPVLGPPALDAIASGLANSDPYQSPYYIVVGPTWYLPLAASFVLAAAWCYWRPSHALVAQLLPAATLSLGALFAVRLITTLPAP